MNIVLLVLGIYLALIFGVAWYFSRNESLETYFVNSKKSGTWLMTFSNVATIIGAGATVAIVSETYHTGISYGLTIPISLITGAIILGIVSKKIKEESQKYEAYTFVDFFEKRFDVKNKILVFFIQLFILIIWIGVQAIAIASLASVLTGIDYNFALILAGGITIFYTAIGGLKVDLITDFIQFWIILIMFVIMAVIGYNNIGGISSLLSSVPEGHLNPFAFGGVIWFIGVIFLSGFIYMGDATNWQRIVSAKNKRVARNSFFLSIPFFILIGLIIVFFGLLASVKLHDINQDVALFELMKSILPPVLVGVGFAAVLAVIMSSVDSLLISGSTILFRALFKKNQFENKKEVLYARLITALFGIAGFSLAFLIPKIVTLGLFVAYLAVSFAIPLLFSLYSEKLSANAVFYAILISFISILIAFPILGPNSFLIPLVLDFGILIFYDKIFKKKIQTPLKIIGFEE